MRKGQWSKSEDQLLIHGIHCYGSQWTKVATCVTTRSADQCAKRWQQSLDPSLDRSEWRDDEDAALLAAVKRLGRHWKDIQEQNLPHRSKNCVKNRYSVLARRNASQLVSYEDSLESSSSDPGTPRQMEANLQYGFTSAPLSYNTTQTSYEQPQLSYASNDGMAPTWSEFNDPDNFLAADYPESHGATSIPSHPTIHPSQVPPSKAEDWNFVQATMGMQQLMQYSAAPPMQFQTYTCPPNHHQPSLYGASSYASPMPQASSSYAPALRPQRQPSQRIGYGQQPRDSVPFGYLHGRKGTDL